MSLRNILWGGLSFLCLSIVPFASSRAVDVYATNTVAPEVSKVATSLTTSMISGRISSVVSGATGGPAAQTIGSLGGGKAAGDQPARGGVWVNVSNNWMAGRQTGADFFGTMKVAVAGADYRVSDALMVGTSVGYERGDFRLKYSGGKMEANNFALAPYVAYILNDVWSVETTAGHAWVDYDISRANGTVSGSTSGSRWFASSNLSANTRIDAWRLGASVGYMYSKEGTDDYTESDGSAARGVKFRLGQAHTTVRAGYVFLTDWGTLNPFAAARAEYDANKTAATAVDAVGTKGYDDRFGMTFTAGVNLEVGDNHTLSLEGSTTRLRDDLDSYSLGGTYRLKF